AVGRAAHRGAGGVPHDEPMGGRLRAEAEVGGAGDGGARDDVLRADLEVLHRPQRRGGAALPERCLQGAATGGARADAHGSAERAEFRTTNPWVDDYELKPKSVVREMAEHAMTFSELISKSSIARSEGVVLRYLTDAYKALRQVVPERMRTEELTELIEWLGALVRQIDSSLLAEWEALQGGDGAAAVLTPAPLGLDSPGAVGESEEEARFGPGPDAPLSANPR